MCFQALQHFQEPTMKSRHNIDFKMQKRTKQTRTDLHNMKTLKIKKTNDKPTKKGKTFDFLPIFEATGSHRGVGSIGNAVSRWNEVMRKSWKSLVCRFWMVLGFHIKVCNIFLYIFLLLLVFNIFNSCFSSSLPSLGLLGLPPRHLPGWHVVARSFG